MTSGEVAKLVTLLAAAFPQRPISAATSEVYEMQLSDIDYELGKAAVGQLLRTSTFLPTIAEIRAAAKTLELGSVRAGADAWGDVLHAIRKVGSYGRPRFRDPIVARCVDALGWRNLCLEGHNDAADRAKFCELYDRLAERERTELAAGLPALTPGPELKRLTASVGRALPQPAPRPDRATVLRELKRIDLEPKEGTS